MNAVAQTMNNYFPHNRHAMGLIVVLIGSLFCRHMVKWTHCWSVIIDASNFTWHGTWQYDLSKFF